MNQFAWAYMLFYHIWRLLILRLILEVICSHSKDCSNISLMLFRYNIEEIFIHSCHNIHRHSICSTLWTCYNHELSSWNFHRFHFNAPGKPIRTVSLVNQFNLTKSCLSNLFMSHLCFSSFHHLPKWMTSHNRTGA